MRDREQRTAGNHQGVRSTVALVWLLVAGACANIFDRNGSDGEPPGRAPRPAATVRPGSGSAGAGGLGGADGGGAGADGVVAGADGGVASSNGGVGGSGPIPSPCPEGVPAFDTDDPIDMVVRGGGGCLTRRGKVWCWGTLSPKLRSTISQAAVLPWEMPGLERVVDLEAGLEHRCALDADGHVFCWGRNESGQAGQIAGGEVCPRGEGETEPCEPKPKRVAAVEGAVGLALGDRTSCARLGDGSVKCWGLATEGSTWLESRTVPEVFALGGIKACVAETDGTVSCSGAPDDVPPGLADITQLSMSTSVWSDLTCALSARGAVTCWGDNDLGGFGVGNEDPNPPEFGQPAILSGAVRVSAQGSHVCVLHCSGRVSCWGENNNEQLGRPSPSCELSQYHRTMSCATEPGSIPGVSNARLVEAGEASTCVALSDGAVWCWGGAAPAFSRPGFIPGFWQDVSGEEVQRTRDAFVAIGDALEHADRDPEQYSCRTAADCKVVSTDLSCYPTCQGPTLREASASRIEQTLRELDPGICAGFEASRATPEVECPELDLRVDCAPRVSTGGEGACVSFDPVTAGCRNACECESLSAGSTFTRQNDCAGSNLIVADRTECANCPRTHYVRVGNIGTVAFEGEIALEHENSTTLASLSVTLEPNELSAPIRLPSNDGGSVRLVAADDCEDAESEFRIASPPDWCQP